MHTDKEGIYVHVCPQVRTLEKGWTDSTKKYLFNHWPSFISWNKWLL